MKTVDVIIIGAGGAGMMCGMQAARRGRRVVILDHAKKIGGKILISGGGRCNFTNTGASPAQYVSKNPDFMKVAFARYTPDDFIGLVKKHGIKFHEKKLGQLFCDESAQCIVELLVSECRESGVEILLEQQISSIRKSDSGFTVVGSEEFECQSLVIASGGFSIPKVGATGFGYRIAKQFGLGLIETVPALDGFTFDEEDHRKWDGLAGVAIDCVMTANKKSFRENLLFTHAGLSGPASLQASLHWDLKCPVKIDFVPEKTEKELYEWLIEKRTSGARAEMKNLLGEMIPKRFSERFCEHYLPEGLHLRQLSNKILEKLSRDLKNYTFVPSGTVGYGKAEVTRGGVDTEELFPETLESKKVPGLYFIGEVVDVTGWLGGYNFQWAWASGFAAGQSV